MEKSETLGMGNSRKYLRHIMDGFHILSPPLWSSEFPKCVFLHALGIPKLSTTLLLEFPIFSSNPSE